MEDKPLKKPKPKKAKKPKKVRKKRKKNLDKKAHYVDAKVFLQDIIDYYECDEISIRLGESIYKIANGLSFASNFINYSYKDEMVGDAILKMFTAVKNKKFNIESGNNPFSYFTTIAFHAFINRIKKEKKHRETIAQYQEVMYGDMLNSGEFSENNIYVDPTVDGDDQ